MWGDVPLRFFFFFFLLCGHACSMWKFQGQGLNLHHSRDPRCFGDNAWSLTCCATRELLIAVLIFISLIISDEHLFIHPDLQGNFQCCTILYKRGQSQVLSMLKNVPSTASFLSAFILRECYIFFKCFSATTKLTMWFGLFICFSIVFFFLLFLF